MKTEENFIKNSTEWQALNNIWKSCTDEQKSALHNDFKIISNLIRQRLGAVYCRQNNEEYRYLNSLSDEAKHFVIALVENGEPNLYHSIMAVLDSKKKATKQEIIEYYFDKFAPKRPYLIENRKLFDEVFELCLKKHLRT